MTRPQWPALSTLEPQKTGEGKAGLLTHSTGSCPGRSLLYPQVCFTLQAQFLVVEMAPELGSDLSGDREGLSALKFCSIDLNFLPRPLQPALFTTHPNLICNSCSLLLHTLQVLSIASEEVSPSPLSSPVKSLSSHQSPRSNAASSMKPLHSFSKHVLSSQNVAGPLLGRGDRKVNKTNAISLRRWTIKRGQYVRTFYVCELSLDCELFEGRTLYRSFLGLRAQYRA